MKQQQISSISGTGDNGKNAVIKAFVAAYSAKLASGGDRNAAYSAGEDAAKDLEMFVSERQFVASQGKAESRAASHFTKFVGVTNAPGRLIDDNKRRVRFVVRQPDGTGLLDDGRIVSAEDMDDAELRGAEVLQINEKFRPKLFAKIITVDEAPPLKAIRQGDIAVRDLGRSSDAA